MRLGSRRDWFLESRGESLQARAELGFLHSHNGRVLFYEILVEERAGEALDVVVFDGTQVLLRKTEFFRDLCYRATLALACAPENSSYGVHNYLFTFGCEVPGLYPGGTIIHHSVNLSPQKTNVVVGVVIANWNRKELLRACLASLAGQTHPSFEVVVVDNGSSDGSVALVEEMAKSYPVRLHLIANTANLGFCAANNQGIQATEGELVALLNNDAEAESGWLEALEQAIRRGEDVGMAASKVLVWEDPAKIDKCGHLIYPDGQNRGRGSGQTDHGQFDRTEEVLWPDGCAAMYRRAMLEDIGGFDEDFFAYADDAELGLRARWAGWRCWYTPDAVVRHHRGATLGLGSARRLTLI